MMMMNPFLWLVLAILALYRWVVIATVVMSWLVAFNVINRSNPYVRQIGYFLEQATEPLLGPIRRRLPNFGGIDVSPIILLIAILFLEQLIPWAFYQIF